MLILEYSTVVLKCSHEIQMKGVPACISAFQATSISDYGLFIYFPFSQTTFSGTVHSVAAGSPRGRNPS